jgi:hypothetical protein
MVDLKFGFNFQFIRDKSKDKIYDETKIEWKPEVRDGVQKGQEEEIK